MVMAVEAFSARHKRKAGRGTLVVFSPNGRDILLESHIPR